MWLFSNAVIYLSVYYLTSRHKGSTRKLKDLTKQHQTLTVILSIRYYQYFFFRFNISEKSIQVSNKNIIICQFDILIIDGELSDT